MISLWFGFCVRRDVVPGSGESRSRGRLGGLDEREGLLRSCLPDMLEMLGAGRVIDVSVGNGRQG